jgi:hypothetical protein
MPPPPQQQENQQRHSTAGCPTAAQQLPGVPALRGAQHPSGVLSPLKAAALAAAAGRSGFVQRPAWQQQQQQQLPPPGLEAVQCTPAKAPQRSWAAATEAQTAAAATEVGAGDGGEQLTVLQALEDTPVQHSKRLGGGAAAGQLPAQGSPLLLRAPAAQQLRPPPPQQQPAAGRRERLPPAAAAAAGLGAPPGQQLQASPQGLQSALAALADAAEMEGAGEGNGGGGLPWPGAHGAAWWQGAEGGGLVGGAAPQETPARRRQKQPAHRTKPPGQR